jgi:hypothetical protein
MSDLGAQWRYEWTVMSEPAVSPVHVFHGGTRDVRGREVHRNDASALKPYRVVVTGGDAPYKELPCLRSGSRPGWWSMKCDDGPTRAPGSVWLRDIWELPPPSGLRDAKIERHSGRAPLVTHLAPSNGRTLLLMAERRMGSDGVLRSYDPFDELDWVPYAETRGGTLRVGGQAPLWSGKVDQPFVVRPDPIWGYFRPPLGDWMLPRAPAYRLYRSGAVVAEGVISAHELRPPKPKPAANAEVTSTRLRSFASRVPSSS